MAYADVVCVLLQHCPDRAMTGVNVSPALLLKKLLVLKVAQLQSYC